MEKLAMRAMVSINEILLRLYRNRFIIPEILRQRNHLCRDVEAKMKFFLPD